MCGVPIVRAEEYLHKLIAQGFRVAVCEQLERPRRGPQARRQERGAPGCDPAGDAGHPHRRRAAGCQARECAAAGGGAHPWAGESEHAYALAFADVSTGSFRVAATALETLGADLARIDPAAEVLGSDALYDDEELRTYWRELEVPVTPLAEAKLRRSQCGKAPRRLLRGGHRRGVRRLHPDGADRRCRHRRLRGSARNWAPARRWRRRSGMRSAAPC